MKDKRIELRVTEREKETLMKKAEACNISLSELILNSALGRPANYAALKNQQFASLDKLTLEINRIGTNINQLVPILRGIAADRKIEDGQYRKLLEELHKYNEKRNIIACELYKYTFQKW